MTFLKTMLNVSLFLRKINVISKVVRFIDYQQRISLLASYYKVSPNIIYKVHNSSPDKEVRKQEILELGLDPYIFRTMLDYTRYSESKNLYKALRRQHVELKDLHILDFGCMVSDYGIFFAKRGAKVAVYDYEKYIDFVKFRFKQAKCDLVISKVGVPYSTLFLNKDLVIFSEVLEHLKNPFEVLKACVQEKVKFIFTSRYPYGDEYYFSLTGHRQSAFDQQPACLELLNVMYKEIILEKFQRLWVRIN